MKFDVYKVNGRRAFTVNLNYFDGRGAALRSAVEWALRNDMSLYYTDLSGARLVDLDLSNVDLAGANLRDANLRDANLTNTSLAEADCTGAKFVGARFVQTNLQYTLLTGADFSGAELRSDFTVADLRAIRADFFEMLLSAIPEVPGLLAALRAGRVDGSTYTGPCKCLVGTVAALRNVPFYDLNPDAARPAERWFTAINAGDTPETNAVAHITEKWILQFLAAIGHDHRIVEHAS